MTILRHLLTGILIMLTIAAMGSGQNRYYTALAQTAYYTAGGEQPGFWMRSGACKALKLFGTVKPEHLSALFEGFHPHTRRPLVQNAGRMTGDNPRKPGWDFTFHLPKTVSVLWAHSDQGQRKVIQQCSWRALRKALGMLEEEAGWCARGKKGAERVPAKLLTAVFPHATSRALDADLHFHCLILNIGLCEDGRSRALISKPLYHWSVVASRYFRVALEAELREHLGLKVYRPVNAKGLPKPLWEVKGVPKGLPELFSKRSEAMRRELGDERVESAAAATVAALKTRPLKEVVPPRQELFQRWQEESRQAGYSAKWVPKVQGRYKEVNEMKQYRQAMKTAVRDLSGARSHFSRRDLMRNALEESMARGLRPEFVRQQVDHDLRHDPQFINLGIRRGQDRYTTRETMAIEKRMLQSAERMYEDKKNPLPEKIVDRAIRRTRIDGKPAELTEEQQRAVRHLTQSPGRIRFVSGLAGTGKTTMLRVTREAFEKAGYELHGCALAGVASKKLAKESGIESETVAMTLRRLNPEISYQFKHHIRQLSRAALQKPTHELARLKLHKKSVLVLDESSMVGTRDFADLVQAVDRAGATMLCLGDYRQLPAIQAGGAFGSLCQRLRSHDMQEIRRQRLPIERERVEKLSRGEAEEVLKEIADEGKLHVMQSPKETQEKLIEHWTRAGGTSSPKKHAMFAPTNQEIDQLNAMAQQARIEQGYVDTRKRIRIGEETFYRGDRIMVTKKNRKLDLENGSHGEVIAIRSNGIRQQMVVRLDDEKESRVIPVRTLLDREFDDIKLGYASTVHRMQGTSVEHAYCLLGGRMTNREMSYVQASRHRETLLLFANENECGVALTNRARQAVHDKERGERGERVERVERALERGLERTREGHSKHVPERALEKPLQETVEKPLQEPVQETPELLRERPGLDPEDSPLIDMMSRSMAEDLAHDVLDETKQQQRQQRLPLERDDPSRDHL